MNRHVQQIIKIIQSFGYAHHRRDIFRDFCEIYAFNIAYPIGNPISGSALSSYARVQKKYTDDDRQKFGEIEIALLDALAVPDDILGQVYMGLDLGSSEMGQFFTPSCVSNLMARLLYPQNFSEHKELKLWGWVSAMEPCCGGGGMLLAQANAMLEAGLNPQKQLFMYGQDIDLCAVHMTYIQLSMCGIPAVVVHGNALDPKDIRSAWKTPMYLIDNWDEKFAFRRKHEKLLDIMKNGFSVDATGEKAPETTPAASEGYSITPANPIKIPVLSDDEKLALFRAKRREQFSEAQKKMIQQNLFD